MKKNDQTDDEKKQAAEYYRQCEREFVQRNGMTRSQAKLAVYLMRKRNR
ncbi:MAG: hypothetical protein JXA04_10675 [Gammaproteobacteria bacterium]|nr:hypothetical protein [Gammaproteobacteria bacterium]